MMKFETKILRSLLGGSGAYLALAVIFLICVISNESFRNP